MTETMSELERKILEQVKKALKAEEDKDFYEEVEETDLEKDIEKANILDRKTVKCKKCGDVGTWTSRGKFPNGTKKWRDHNHLIANGRICGTCNQKRAKVTMQRVRADENPFYKDLD